MRASRVAILGFWVGFFGLLAAGCRPTPERAGKPGATGVSAPLVPVVVEEIQRSRMGFPIEASGWLVWKDEAPLGFVASGVIAEVNVRTGDRVEAGKVLARLRPEELDGRVGQARANVDRWRQDLERGRRLLSTGVMTREQVDHLEAALADGENQLKAAEFARQHGEVVAPVAGVVLARRAEPGQVVAAGVPVLDFAGESGGWLCRVGLPEAEVRQLRVGALGEAWLGSGGGLVTGRVARLAGAVDPATRLVTVEMELDQAPEGARSGFAMNVRLQPVAGEERIQFSASALMDGRGRDAWVYRVQDGKAHRARVRVDQFQGDRVRAWAELPLGTRVVIRGAEFLREGAAVTEVSPGAHVAVNR